MTRLEYESGPLGLRATWEGCAIRVYITQDETLTDWTHNGPLLEMAEYPVQVLAAYLIEVHSKLLASGDVR